MKSFSVLFFPHYLRKTFFTPNGFTDIYLPTHWPLDPPCLCGRRVRKVTMLFIVFMGIETCTGCKIIWKVILMNHTLCYVSAFTWAHVFSRVQRSETKCKYVVLMYTSVLCHNDICSAELIQVEHIRVYFSIVLKHAIENVMCIAYRRLNFQEVNE